MVHRFAAMLGIVALASCGAAADRKTGRLSLASSDIAAGQPIPAVHSCDGANRSPALSWSDPPGGTRSFALVVDDPDAPSGTFRHWGAYDIPAAARSISAGQQLGKQAKNDTGKPGYSGPCPPKGSAPHHYHFKLFALDVDQLDLGPMPTVAAVENAAMRHAIAKAELVATYQRQ